MIHYCSGSQTVLRFNFSRASIDNLVLCLPTIPKSFECRYSILFLQQALVIGLLQNVVDMLLKILANYLRINLHHFILSQNK